MVTKAINNRIGNVLIGADYTIITGVVRIRVTEPFLKDMEYVLYVKAEDQNGRDGNKWQSIPEERLSIGKNKNAFKKIEQICISGGSNGYLK